MRIELFAVGDRGPAWADAAYDEYRRRLPFKFDLNLVAPGRHSSAKPVSSAIQHDGDRLLRAIPARAYVVALDEHGRQFSSVELAARLQHWMELGRDISLLIGGANGLARACLDRADEVWSLSRLTLPHVMARLVVVEQIYRAWSILEGHPYHRGAQPGAPQRMARL